MWCFETEITIAIMITKKSVIDCNQYDYRLRLPTLPLHKVNRIIVYYLMTML